MMNLHVARRTFVRAVISVIAALLTMLFGASPAAAHNTFVSSSPADGEVLTTAPSTWVTKFEKSVPLNSASGEIILANGVRVPLAPPRHSESDAVLEFDLPPNLEGGITARWRLVGTDGHVISGRVSFTIAAAGVALEPAAVDTVTSESQVGQDDASPGVPDIVRVLVRFVNYVALVLLVGVLFAEWFVAEGALGTARGRRLLQLTSWGTATAPMLTLLVFVNDTQKDGEGWLSAAGDAIGFTAGSMLIFRTAAGVVVVAVVRAMRHRAEVNERTLQLMVLVMVMYSVALAYGGHSRSQQWPWLGVPIDVVHVAGVAVWFGGLVVLIVVVVPSVDDATSLVAFRRFGRAAEWAVAIIVATGVVQTVRLHSEVTTLFTTPHGLLLLAKVLGVLVMMRLGSTNRRRLADARSSRSRELTSVKRMVIRSSIIEATVGMAVVAATAMLVAASLA